MSHQPQILSRRALLDADWARLCSFSAENGQQRSWYHAFKFRFMPVWIIRTAQALYRAGWPRAAKLISTLNVLIFHIECPARLDIGPGLVIMHPQGIILGAANIGHDVSLYQHVTLGAVKPDFAYTPSLRPTIEAGVSLTAGCKVLGGITVGENAVVGANAVVLEDVPADHNAVGIPARMLPQRGADMP